MKPAERCTSEEELLAAIKADCKRRSAAAVAKLATDARRCVDVGGMVKAHPIVATGSAAVAGFIAGALLKRRMRGAPVQSASAPAPLPASSPPSSPPSSPRAQDAPIVRSGVGMRLARWALRVVIRDHLMIFVTERLAAFAQAHAQPHASPEPTATQAPGAGPENQG